MSACVEEQALLLSLKREKIRVCAWGERQRDWVGEKQEGLRVHFILTLGDSLGQLRRVVTVERDRERRLTLFCSGCND